MSTAEQKARADRLHNRIQQIIAGRPAAPVKPRTPREFIEQKMVENEQEDLDCLLDTDNQPPLKPAKVKR